MISMLRGLAALSLFAFSSASQAAQSTRAFEVQFAREAFDTKFTGEVFVALSEKGDPLRSMHSWFAPTPVLRFELTDIEPGTSVTLVAGDAAAHFPTDWSSVRTGIWRVQAIARLSRAGRQAGLSAGDVLSEVLEIQYDPAAEENPDDTAPVSLQLATTVEERPFQSTDRVVQFEFVSPSLSEFYGFEYKLRAGVRLPKDYGDHGSYPVVYSVTGFGGTSESIHRWNRRIAEDSPLDHCLLVVPDASNRYGHSVFCDSESIGPWGEALVRELIPALEEKFSGAGAEHRYVTGVSSGGWSSLWLQVAYPAAFAGCWSHVPDPIDFHDFQQINIYEPLPDGSPRNMYVDEHGERRPLARRNGEVLLYYEDFVRHEHVLNPGGQIRSFEATFSPPTEDGSPRRIFDVETGVIDHAAAQAWRPYDISHQLLTRWDELRADLSGKIHVYAGEVDTFYLEGAVERFQGLAREAGLLEEMVIEVIPGMPHALHAPGLEAMGATIEERWSAAAKG